MLVAYILSKSRFLKTRIIRLKDSNVFKHGNFEYKVDREKIYQKKFLGFKLFFWSMYLEGNPDPIEFRDRDYSISYNDVPIDDIALILHKLKMLRIEIISIIILAFNLLLTIGVVYKLYG